MISFNCSCGKLLLVRDRLAGCSGLCPGCGRVSFIPSSDQPNPNYEHRGESLPSTSMPTPDVRRGVASILKAWEYGGELFRWEEDDFFASPPAEIGTLLYAVTDMRTWMKSSRGSRTSDALVLGYSAWPFGAFVMIVFCELVGIHADLVVVPSLLFWVAVSLIYYCCTRFDYHCMYVGREGIARFRCRGSPDQLTSERFLFREASCLRIAQRKNSILGWFRRTNFRFTWTDDAGRVLFVHTGWFDEKYGGASRHPGYWCAVSIEKAWTDAAIEIARTALWQSGEARFPLLHGDRVVLKPDGLLVHLNGTTKEYQRTEIRCLLIVGESILVLPTDSRTTVGVSFSYVLLANVGVFRVLLREALGLNLT